MQQLSCGLLIMVTSLAEISSMASCAYRTAPYGTVQHKDPLGPKAVSFARSCSCGVIVVVVALSWR